MTETFEQQPFNPGPLPFPDPSQRCPCLLLLDVSASMSGRPIEELIPKVMMFDLYEPNLAFRLR